jgi:hypothetical protein
VPVVIGIPAIRPLGLRARPAGKAVVTKAVGELLAVIWYWKGMPTYPLALVELLIIGVCNTTNVAGLDVMTPTALATITV